MRKLILLFIGSLLLLGCATKPIVVTDNYVCSDLCADINELHDLELQYTLVQAIGNSWEDTL